MSFTFKAKLLAKQGMSSDEILERLLPEVDLTFSTMDRKLARFIEEATPEQDKWLMEDMGLPLPEEDQVPTPR